MANELQLAAGLKLTNPAPADAYYCKPQVGQAPAQPYATPAEACSFVPQPLRYQGMTVNVAGIGEMSWLTDDLSNNGLVLKVVPGDGTGSGGSPAIYADFIFTAETDGAQSFPMPAGTLGIDGQPTWYQADTGLADTLANWDLLDGSLVVYAATKVKSGDKFFGRRYYGGAPVAGGAGSDPGTGDIDASRIKGVLAEENFPALTPAKVSQLTDVVNQENAQRGPLVLVAQPLLDTPQDGALEFNGVNLFFTTGGVRSQLN